MEMYKISYKLCGLIPNKDFLQLFTTIFIVSGLLLYLY